MAPRIRLNAAWSPRKRNLANPYPAAAASRAAPTALTPAYAAVLSSQWTKTPSSWVKVALMFARSCGASENHRPKLLIRSWVPLVEATSSQNSGRRK